MLEHPSHSPDPKAIMMRMTTEFAKSTISEKPVPFQNKLSFYVFYCHRCFARSKPNTTCLQYCWYPPPFSALLSAFYQTTSIGPGTSTVSISWYEAALLRLRVARMLANLCEVANAAANLQEHLVGNVGAAESTCNVSGRKHLIWRLKRPARSSAFSRGPHRICGD
jgi:hypothetical protein